MNWYYVDQGQQAGPVEDAQLEELRRSGRIQSSTLVWREGMANWATYGDALREGASSGAPEGHLPPVERVGPEAICGECGQIYAIDQMIRHGQLYVCSNCKPAFVQKLAEGARVSPGVTYGNELQYGGFWIRFAAKLIDNLIVGGVIFIPVFIFLFYVGIKAFNEGGQATAAPGTDFMAAGQADFGGFSGILFQLLFVGLNIIYSTFFLGRYGATPGKMICRMVVVDTDGRKISYARAFGRGCAEVLSRMICLIGYIMAAFDREKRALHDHICNTRVILK